MNAPLNDWETFVMVAALGAGIAATRFAPFLLFRNAKKLPPAIHYLAGTLPRAAMALLVVYCLKDVAWLKAPHGAPELLAMAFTAALHLWRRNMLLSIAAGTAAYMFLAQQVFAQNA